MHRNASPHSHPSSGVPWEGLPCSHMEVNALAVHSEQVVCNEHTKRQPASAILCTAACTVLSCSGSTGGLLSPWPWAIWRIGIFQLYCRLTGSLSHVIYLTETSIIWHMTDDEKQLSSEQKSNLQVLLFLQARKLRRDRKTLRVFQPSLVKVLLWRTISRWG